MRRCSLAQAELAENLFVEDAFASPQRDAGLLQSRGGFVGDLFLFYRRIGQRAGQRFYHDFEEMTDGGQLVRIETLEQRVSFHARSPT